MDVIGDLLFNDASHRVGSNLLDDGPHPKSPSWYVMLSLCVGPLCDQGVLEIDIGKGGGVLVVVPTTPFSRNEATYWVEIESIDGVNE